MRLSFAIFAFSASAWAQTGAVILHENAVPDEFIVVLRGNADASALAQELSSTFDGTVSLPCSILPRFVSAEANVGARAGWLAESGASRLRKYVRFDHECRNPAGEMTLSSLLAARKT